MIKQKNGIVCVITGDVVGFSKLDVSGRQRMLAVLKSSFRSVASALPGSRPSFEIYRGDSFQGILLKPESALRSAACLRAELRFRFKAGSRREVPDIRLAAGIGRADYLPQGRFLEGDGEAFRFSGPFLDAMKGDRRLSIHTPWPEINSEFEAVSALLDAVIHRWSAEQAQAVAGFLRGLGQLETAKALGISQPAVRQRLRSAGGWAVDLACRRFEFLIEKKISL
jgi:hypothetical protein